MILLHVNLGVIELSTSEDLDAKNKLPQELNFVITPDYVCLALNSKGKVQK